MKRSKLIAIREFIAKFSNKPWACFETSGPTEDGNVAFSISANKAFLENLQKMGLAGQTDDETLQYFFLGVRMSPLDNNESDIVNPEQMPNLSSEANILKR